MKKEIIQGKTEEIACFLLGKYLVFDSENGKLGGYIVETEAYVGIEDEASHSYQGKRTPRMASMYKAAGTIYLYTMHTHLLLNIVTQGKGIPEGVLIRGIQPVEGLEQMEKNRNKVGIDVTNGPGKVTKALGLSSDLNGQSIFTSKLHLCEYRQKIPQKITTSPRIGIPNKGKWTEKELRYFVNSNPYVSRMPKNKIDWERLGWKE